MKSIFLSYSKRDHFFADLADIKLAAAGFEIWRDQGQLRPGSDWRQGIERGISDSLAVLVALSESSAQSPYVTFEWAYALGKGRAVIPLKLNDCEIHPKLETIQYLDFTIPAAPPWESLFERIREIETDVEQTTAMANAAINVSSLPQQDDTYARAILSYLNQRGYQMASFDRLRKRIDTNLTDEKLNEIIIRNPGVFRHARLAEGKPGIAKEIP